MYKLIQIKKRTRRHITMVKIKTNMLLENFKNEREKIIERGLDKPQKDNALYIKGSEASLIVNGVSYSAQVEVYFIAGDKIRMVSTFVPENISIEFLLKGKKKALLSIITEHDRENYAIGYGENNPLAFLFFIKANGTNYWLTSINDDDAFQMLEIEDELMGIVSPLLEMIRNRCGVNHE